MRSLPALPKSLSGPWSPSMLSLPWPPMIQSAPLPPVAVSSPSPSQATSRPAPRTTASPPARARMKSEPALASIVSASAVPLMLSRWSVPFRFAANAAPANSVALAPTATSDEPSVVRLMFPSTRPGTMSCGVSTLTRRATGRAHTARRDDRHCLGGARRAACLAPAAAAAQHHLRADRRPVLEPGPVHAARAADAARGDDVHELLRDRLALLPVARVDLQRPLPAQPRRADEHAADRRVRRVPPRRRGGDVRDEPAGQWLPNLADGQVPERLRGPGRLRRAGLEQLAGIGKRLSRLQLRAERERTRSPLRPLAAGLPHGRVAAPRQGVRGPRGALGPPVPARGGQLRAAPAVNAGAARPPRLSGSDGATGQRLRRRARGCARVVARPRVADRGAGRGNGHRVPQARAVGAGGGRSGRAGPPLAARARAGPQHVRDLQLRQRLPHGPAPPAGREDDCLRQRHPGSADRGGPRRSRGFDNGRTGRERRPGADVHAAGGSDTAAMGRRPRSFVALPRRGPLALARLRAGRAPPSGDAERRP